VLLARAADNDNAGRFYTWLRSPDAREIIGRHGYELTP
jgi:accessory colonization factor AcfC